VRHPRSASGIARSVALGQHIDGRRTGCTDVERVSIRKARNVPIAMMVVTQGSFYWLACTPAYQTASIESVSARAESWRSFAADRNVGFISQVISSAADVKSTASSGLPPDWNVGRSCENLSQRAIRPSSYANRQQVSAWLRLPH
jgi:hypothetical protein